MNTCNICYNDLIVPVIYPCSHIFCLLCLDLGTINCPSCDIEIKNMQSQYQNIKYKNHIWLYSSNFNNKWWCYDIKSTRMIETIYTDYCLIKEMNDIYTDLDLGINLRKKITKTISNDAAYIKINDDDLDNYDEVNFEDDDSLNKSFSSDQIKKKSSGIPYIIKAGNTEYRIDFENMRQINTIDNTKTRKIKRLEIPNSIIEDGYDEILEFLKCNNVIGISGKKFQKS